MMGHQDVAAKCQHINFGLVLGMSTRKGQYTLRGINYRGLWSGSPVAGYMRHRLTEISRHRQVPRCKSLIFRLALQPFLSPGDPNMCRISSVTLAITCTRR